MGAWKTIVVGVDGSPNSRTALTWAAAEAADHGADLVVINVWEHTLLPPAGSVSVSERYVADPSQRTAEDLVNVIKEELGENPFSGVVLVFRAKRRDKVKIVHWDATGLVLVWKQLEGGRFCWPPITDGTVRLSALQFAALFSGLDYLRLPSERRIPPPTAAA